MVFLKWDFHYVDSVNLYYIIYVYSVNIMTIYNQFCKSIIFVGFLTNTFLYANQQIEVLEINPSYSYEVSKNLLNPKEERLNYIAPPNGLVLWNVKY